ncbi:MAG: hypothetical protein ACXWKG_18830, partial [Limisphaerales bacterium]
MTQPARSSNPFMRWPKMLLVASIVGSFVLWWLSITLNKGHRFDYYIDILLKIGINITLAVSLNLI